MSDQDSKIDNEMNESKIYTKERNEVTENNVSIIERNYKKEEIGINTSALDPEELKRLVENNPELLEELKERSMISKKPDKSDDNIKNQSDIKDMDKMKNDISQKQELMLHKKKRQEKINQLDEKDKIIKILKESNNELESKIISANEQYLQIVDRIKENPVIENEKEDLENKLKNLEKDVITSNAEMESYKKSIDSLKNKMEFKINLDKAMNLENILKTESIKSKDIKKEIESLTKMNNAQLRTLNNIDKENRYTEKIEILKVEIKNLKENLKENIEKNSKQEKYIRTIHEKISQLENQIKKLTQPRIEIKKSFTKEDLKDTLESLNRLKLEINSKRDILKDLNKSNEEKLMSFISLNKRIEQDYKENDKMNKMLIFKKNELKRLVKNNNSIENRLERMENKLTKKIIQSNNDLSHLFPKNIPKTDEESIINPKIMQEELIEINEDNQIDERPKLFSKNPNKDDSNKNIEDEEEEKEEYFQQNDSDEESLNKDDSNINRSVDKNNQIQNFNVELY